MRSYTVLAALLFLTPAVAHACTQQEAKAKGTKLRQIGQAKMAQDPARAGAHGQDAADHDGKLWPDGQWRYN